MPPTVVKLLEGFPRISPTLCFPHPILTGRSISYQQSPTFSRSALALQLWQVNTTSFHRLQHPELRPNMAEASASSHPAQSHAPIRGPGSHRVHSSCDRCRSRKTKVGPLPCRHPCSPVDVDRSASIQVRRTALHWARLRRRLREKLTTNSPRTLSILRPHWCVMSDRYAAPEAALLSCHRRGVPVLHAHPRALLPGP